jgi:predicted nucleic acid-binding protein
VKPALFLLDTSFLIDLGREMDASEEGPAHRTLARLPAGRIFVSPVTVAELLEGAEDEVESDALLNKYHHLTIGTAAAHRCALNQSRATQRMGENDAWQAALAVTGGLTLVGHDRAFDRRPWLSYLDHAKA